MGAFNLDSLKKMVDPQWKKHTGNYKKFGYTDEQKKQDADAYRAELIKTYKAMCPEIEDYINSLEYE